ncbi:MAG: hypothetical protein KU28_07700, partial [Sulfurovum sp. PC08-66]
TALKYIFGILVQLQMTVFVRTQKLYKTSRRSHLIRIDLMNGTNGDTLPTLDTRIGCGFEIKYLFYCFIHFFLSIFYWFFSDNLFFHEGIIA